MAHLGNVRKSGASLSAFIDEIAARQLRQIKGRGVGLVETDIANAVAETIDAIEKVIDGPGALGIAKAARGGRSLKARKLGGLLPQFSSGQRIADAQLALASCPTPAERVVLRQRLELAKAG